MKTVKTYRYIDESMVCTVYKRHVKQPTAEVELRLSSSRHVLDPQFKLYYLAKLTCTQVLYFAYTETYTYV